MFHLHQALSNFSPLAWTDKQGVNIHARCAPQAIRRTNEKHKCLALHLQWNPCGDTLIQTAAQFQYSHDELLSLCCRNWEHSQSLLKFTMTLEEQLCPTRSWGLHRRHCSPGGTAVGLCQGPSSVLTTLMTIGVNWGCEKSQYPATFYIYAPHSVINPYVTNQFDWKHVFHLCSPMELSYIHIGYRLSQKSAIDYSRIY